MAVSGSIRQGFVRSEDVVFVEGFFELDADVGHGVGSEVAAIIELP